MGDCYFSWPIMFISISIVVFLHALPRTKQKAFVVRNLELAFVFVLLFKTSGMGMRMRRRKSAWELECGKCTDVYLRRVLLLCVVMRRIRK